MSENRYEYLKSELELRRRIRSETRDMLPQDAADYEFAARRAWDLAQAEGELNRQRANTPQGGMADALKNYGEELAKSGEHWSAVWTKGLTGVEDALTNFVMTGKLSFRELALSIVADLARIAIQQAVMVPLTKFLQSMIPGGTGLFAAGGVFAPSAPAEPFAEGGAFVSQRRVAAFAKGEGFGAARQAGASASPTPFANGSGFTNSVVKTPTLFNFMRGQKKALGLMGEAGPEAVVPLKKGAGGLGVSAYGADGEATVPLKRGPGGRLGIDRDQLEATRSAIGGSATPSLSMFARGGSFGAQAQASTPAAPRAPRSVRPVAQTSPAASGGTTVSVQVNIEQVAPAETTTQATSQDGRALGQAIASAVQTEIVKQKRPGGLLAA
jgi:hypothetical protein